MSIDKGFGPALKALHRELAACRACPGVAGTPVHGGIPTSRVLLVGQAPGVHEAALGRPFAYTAGRTLFRWIEEATGVDEARFRAAVYMAAVARCFPGKSTSGGDRVPDAGEISRCRRFLVREVALLEPRLVLAVGNLAIREVLGPRYSGPKARLADVVGKSFRVALHGCPVDVVALPHPSGASSWHKTEPGKTLLAGALALLSAHRAWRLAFPRRSLAP